MQDGGYLAKIMNEGGYLARIKKNSRKIFQDSHSKIYEIEISAKQYRRVRRSGGEGEWLHIRIN